MRIKLSPQARTLLVVCLAAGCWAFGFGLAAPSGLCSLWLQQAGCNDTLIGLNTSVYYFGILLASLFVPWMMRAWGRGCVVAGMVMSGISVALFPWGLGLSGWLILRFINGLAGAMSLVPTETMVNHNAPPEQRARNFGFYAFSVALGIALGIVSGLPLFDAHPYIAFFLGGAVSLVGAVLMGYCLPQEATMPHEAHGHTPLEVTKNLLSFGSAWSQGFLEGGMVAFLTTYLLFLGCAEGLVSWLLAGTMIGVIAFQVPVAWLADKLGRTTVLLSCYAFVSAGLVCLPLSAGSIWLGVWLFLLGACSSAFYPLGLSLLGERVPPSDLARANAWYLALNCLGSLTGPVLMGKAMDAFGKSSLFVVGEAAVLLVLVAWAGVQLHARRRSSPISSQPHGSCDTNRPAAA
jgi:MFS family permease